MGSLQAGTMFGEEEVIENIPRKYTAATSNTQKLLICSQ
jgi:hypothetical protein